MSFAGWKCCPCCLFFTHFLLAIIFFLFVHSQIVLFLRKSLKRILFREKLVNYPFAESHYLAYLQQRSEFAELFEILEWVAIFFKYFLSLSISIYMCIYFADRVDVITRLPCYTMNWLGLQVIQMPV